MVANELDVLRGGSAAAANEPRTSVDHSPGVLSHVLGAGQVDLSITHRARNARIGLSRERAVRHAGYPLDSIEHDRRPHGTVEPDDIGSQFGEAFGDGLHRCAVGGVAILTNGHLCDDREIR